MKIINLEAISGGYSGFFIKEQSRYHKFRITASSHVIIPLKVPPQINNYNQFLDMWKNMGRSPENFLQEPMDVSELTIEELKKVEKNLPTS